MPEIKVRIITKHRKDCQALKELPRSPRASAWWFSGGKTWADARGRIGNGSGHKWLDIRCLDGDCPARAIVLESFLLAAVEQATKGGA